MKKYIGSIVILAIIICIFFLPKVLETSDKKISFQTMEPEEMPESLKEVLPKYLPEERALSCKVGDEVYVIVTRGEKKTEGYTVKLDRIEREKKNDGGFTLTVYALYEDPKPDEIVQQRITYPFIIVKTNLKDIPDEIELETEYID